MRYALAKWVLEGMVDFLAVVERLAEQVTLVVEHHRERVKAAAFADHENAYRALDKSVARVDAAVEAAKARYERLLDDQELVRLDCDDGRNEADGIYWTRIDEINSI
jgi:hypothetical protein